MSGDAVDSDQPVDKSVLRPVSGLDGAFLAFESPTMHMHIVGVLILDPNGVPGGVGFHQIRQMVAKRIPTIPPFRSRMVEVPFGLQHPSMVDDPDFDIDFHVRRASLPVPGGPDELALLVGDIAGHPLDRSRPLWEFHVIEGLEHGHLALVSKVHHSIIDGVSGAEILASFLDLSSNPESLSDSAAHREVNSDVDSDVDGSSEDKRSTWSPPAVPGQTDRLRNALGSLPSQTDRVARTLGTTLMSARSLSNRNREVQGTLPPTPFQAPRTSINRAISGHRRVQFVDVPLADIRRVREVLGGTVNDVVLAMASGALRIFFAERQEVIESSLVAMVPVSIRRDEDRGALGNQVAPMLVSLASGVGEPAARLRAISEGVRAAKEQQRTVGSEIYSKWAQALFPAVATRVSRLLSNLRVFDYLPPLCNVTVSNIPGPDFPLYMAGARLVAMYPVGPIAEGVGVNITVFSYLDTLYIGTQGCWDLVPDLEVLANGMVVALGELVKEAERRDRPVPWWHAEGLD